MKRKVYSAFALTATLVIGQLSVYGQAPLGSEFTYQGQLKDAGLPADGDYDFVFRLYDADTGGAQVGGDVTVDDWPVADGLFTVPLDFGAGVFTSDARWIEIDVRDGAGGSDYTTLWPRQPVTAAPVALYALDGPGSGGYWTLNGDDIYNNNAGGVGIGTTSPASMLDVQSTEDTHGIMSAVPWIAVWAHRTATTGTYPAIHGECDSEAAYGSAVRGIMTSTSPGSSSAAVLGINNGTGGAGIGVHGSQDGSGYGVYGFTPDGRGVYGRSTDGTGVWGATDSDSWSASGVKGVVNSTSPGLWSAGVHGHNNGTGDFGYGVHGSQDGSGVGVYGSAPSGYGVYGAAGDGTGVYGLSNDGIGVWGTTDSDSWAASGVLGVVSSTNPGMWSAGVRGQNADTGDDGMGVFGSHDGSGIGVYGFTPSGTGVKGATDSVLSNAMGVQGVVNSTAPGGYSAGVRGHNNGTGSLGIGVWGSQDGSGWGVHGFAPSGRGVYGSSTDGVGVRGHSDNGYAGYFTGPVRVSVLEIVGADVAEKFPVSDDATDVRPGTVMEIDPENPGMLRVARGAYNRRVAGVVSGAGDIPAGTILGNLPGSEDAPAIALSGRVWVHCDASQTAIETGDLLTTSDTPGHAMAVSDFSRAHGAVIGKAMTPLARGETGMVLVLVNLQ